MTIQRASITLSPLLISGDADYFPVPFYFKGSSDERPTLVHRVDTHELTTLLEKCHRWSDITRLLEMTSPKSFDPDSNDLVLCILSWSVRWYSFEGLKWVFENCAAWRPILLPLKAYIRMLQVSHGKHVPYLQKDIFDKLFIEVSEYIRTTFEKMESEVKRSSMPLHSALYSLLNSTAKNQKKNISFQKRSLHRNFLRAMALCCRQGSTRHAFCNLLLEISISNMDKSGLIMFLDVLPKEGMNITTKTNIHSLLNKAFRRKHWNLRPLIDQSSQDTLHTNPFNIQLDIAIQYAYIICECAHVHYLQQSYESLCAHLLFGLQVPLKNYNLERAFELCKLCAITALPQSIQIVNHILQSIVALTDTSNSVRNLYQVLQSHFRKTTRSFTVIFSQESSKTFIQKFISRLVEEFLLAASSSYLSPRDLLMWSSECKSHKDVFRSLPVLSIPSYNSVDELLQLLSPKTSSLLTEASTASNGPVYLHDKKSKHIVINIGKVLYFTRFRTPPFLLSILNDDDENESFNLVYDSASALIICKKSGSNIAPSNAIKTECQSQSNTPEKISNSDILNQLSNIQRYGVVHRIDNETSGLFMVAKTQESFVHYKNLFFQSLAQNLRRYYVAILYFYSSDYHCDHGGEDVCDVQIASQFVHALTLKSSIRVSSIQTSGPYALVRIELLNGKKHVIRRIFSDPKVSLDADATFAGKSCRHCILLGETLYGPPGLGASPLIDRVALHAGSIEFSPPDCAANTQGNVIVEASLPQDMRNAWIRICALHYSLTGAV